MIKRVLVALDGSDHANRAMDLACDVASRYGAELIAVHVIPDRSTTPAERCLAQAELEAGGATDFHVAPLVTAATDARVRGQGAAAQAAEAQGRLRWAVGRRLMSHARARAREKAVSSVRTITLTGDPAKQILRVAGEEHADLIVMGRRGLGDLGGLLLGSVSHEVARLADCACLTVK